MGHENNSDFSFFTFFDEINKNGSSKSDSDSLKSFRGIYLYTARYGINTLDKMARHIDTDNYFTS